MKYTYIKKLLSLILCICCVFTVFCTTTAYADGEKSSVVAYGIDVSFWQGKIDWKKVKQSGKTFAIIRAGSTKGMDDYFEENYKNAKAAGVYLGCYFYTYATTKEEALKDADMLLSWLKDKQFEYPVFYDMEDKAQQGLTKDKRTEMCLAFINRMEKAGWFTGTYANATWYKNNLDEKALGEAGELWLAAWTDSGEPSKDYSDKYGMWQYSSTGKVSGINGNVDLDVAYRNYPEIMRMWGYNGYASEAEVEILDEEWVITSSDGVNVRELPGVVFKKVGFLPNNARIHITAKVKDTIYTWGRIEYDGKTAWCVLNYAKKVRSTLSSNSDIISLKDKLVTGLTEGEEVYEDLFKVDGLAKIKIQQTKNGFGTGTQVNLILGNTVTDTYYIVIPGDINGDLYVDTFDLSFSISVANFETDFDKKSAEFAASDVNCDGVCDVFDSEIISMMTIGYSEESETPEEAETPQEPETPQEGN